MTEEEIQKVYEILVALAPPMSSISPVQVKTWISLAEDYVCRKRFKAAYYKAVALYALHLMLLDGALKNASDSVETMGRRVTSFSLSGEFSQTFSDASRTSDPKDTLTQTPWGKMYRALLRKNGGSLGIITASRGGCR